MMIMTMLRTSLEDNNKMASFLSIDHLILTAFGGKKKLFLIFVLLWNCDLPTFYLLNIMVSGELNL